jgi:hypothetical protein
MDPIFPAGNFAFQARNGLNKQGTQGATAEPDDTRRCPPAMELLRKKNTGAASIRRKYYETTAVLVKNKNMNQQKAQIGRQSLDTKRSIHLQCCRLKTSVYLSYK